MCQQSWWTDTYIHIYELITRIIVIIPPLAAEVSGGERRNRRTPLKDTRMIKAMNNNTYIYIYMYTCGRGLRRQRRNSRAPLARGQLAAAAASHQSRSTWHQKVGWSTRWHVKLNTNMESIKSEKSKVKLNNYIITWIPFGDHPLNLERCRED